MLQLDSLTISQSGGQTAIVLFVQNNGLGSFLHMHTICVSASPDSALLLAAKGWEACTTSSTLKARSTAALPALLLELRGVEWVELSLEARLPNDTYIDTSSIRIKHSEQTIVTPSLTPSPPA
ncbi:MAG: hypothetical protein SGPRY_011499 [Prymnesium sp.]